jgi:hypothetical protein
MQQVFKNAFFFVEPTVLKRRLQPLCAGHVMILMSADSPFAADTGEEPTISHLAFAVGICSRTYKDADAWLHSEKLVDDVTAWGKACGDLNFLDEILIFRAYLARMSEFPLRWQKSKTPQPCQHPWPLLLVTAIMPLVGEDRAWGMPLPKAVAHWSALQEIQGDRMLKTDWELAAIEKMKEAEAKKQKESQNEK